MKTGSAATAITNVLVIAGVGFYFIAGLSPGQQQARDAANPTVALSLSAAEWKQLTLDAPTVGDGSAAPFAVEFIDYECPFCRSSHSDVTAFLSADRDRTLAVRQYPLPMHAAAEGASRAALCAEEQGRFDEMHTRLLTDTLWHHTEDWIALAQEIAVADLAAFRDCLPADRTTEALEVDRQLAERFGVRATPTFIAFGALHEGAINRRILDRLAAGVAP